MLFKYNCSSRITPRRFWDEVWGNFMIKYYRGCKCINKIKKQLKQLITTFINHIPITKFPADLVTFTEEILNGKLHFFVQWVMLRVANAFFPEKRTVVLGLPRNFPFYIAFSFILLFEISFVFTFSKSIKTFLKEINIFI